MKNIVIIGAGDLGKEVVWLIEDINRINPTYVILGFLDDDKAKDGGEFYGYRVLGDTSLLESLSVRTPLCAVIAIQDGKIRRKIKERYDSFKEWESIVHPTAVIASTSPIGRGGIVFPNVTVSVDTCLGDFELLYINSTICNDCVLGDFVSIMSGVSISEHARIGDECFLAASSCVYPNVKLGRNSEVAVAATVARDYSENSKVGDKDSHFFLFK